LAVMAVGMLFLIPSDRVAALAATQFEKVTGRVLTLSGSVRPSFWPIVGVRTGAVTISNAKWSDSGAMLAAEALSIGVDMSALVSGVVRITEVRATAPRILLERARDGRVNWDFGASASGGQATAGGAGTPFTLDRGIITGGSVTYLDHATGSRTELSGIDATAEIPAFNGPANVTLAATFNGQRVDLKAALGSFAGFVDGKVVQVELAASLGKDTMDFKGRLGTSPLAAEGRIETALPDMAALFAALGQPAPSLPEGLGRRSVGASGNVTLTAQDTLHLRDAKVRLDGNTIGGAADLAFGGARPHLNAQITTGALNLASLAAGNSDSSAAASGWSKAPIDASALSALDAEIALTADSIDLGTLKLAKTRTLVTIDKGRAVFDIREMRGYEGLVTGQFVVNGRSGLSVGGDLVVGGVALQPMLRDLADYERLIGTGDMTLKFLGVGNSLDAIMHSLSGEGRLTFGKGELQGLDLAGMLRNLDPGYVGKGAKTIFDSITTSFTIKDGTLTSDDLVFKAPLVQATGKGSVGIGAQTLDYRIVPVAMAKADGTGGLKVPLRVSGPWSKPKFQFDLESVTDQKLEVEKKKLEDKAKAALATKAQDELGVVPQEGESLEDAAKRAAEEAAAKALKKLLGGN
jgi:AsmA protein